MKSCMKSRKVAQMTLFAGQGADSQMQRTDVWTQGEERSVGGTGRRGWIHIHICVKQTTSEKLLESPGSSAQPL